MYLVAYKACHVTAALNFALDRYGNKKHYYGNAFKQENNKSIRCSPFEDNDFA